MFAAISEFCVEAHIQNICCHAASVPCEEDVVPMELDCFNVSCLSGDNTRAVCDEVATDCDPCSFGVFLFRADGANDPREGDCSALGDLVLVDEEDCVGSFDSVSNALG